VDERFTAPLCLALYAKHALDNPHNLRAPNGQQMRNHVVPPFAATGLLFFLFTSDTSLHN
jgi:hypothetical protein